MTITIGKRALLVFLVVVLIGGVGVGGYLLGHGSEDTDAKVRAAVQESERLAKGRESAAFESGRQKGDEEGRSALVKQYSSKDSIRGDMLEYLGFSDWKDGAWYLVRVVKRPSLNGNTTIFSINDRTKMSPGLAYSLCGDDNESYCYIEQ